MTEEDETEPGEGEGCTCEAMAERLDTDDPGPRLTARSHEPLRPDENR